MATDTSRTIPSALAGVNSGPEAAQRQQALRVLQDAIRADPENPLLRALELIPEWDNPFDGDAIRVEAQVPGMGRVQLGYIRNGETRCSFCENVTPAYPRNNTCTRCKQVGQLERVGTARKLSQQLRKDPRCRFLAEITEVTGGVGEKANFGCNVLIRPITVSRKEKQAESSGDYLPPEPPPPTRSYRTERPEPRPAPRPSAPARPQKEAPALARPGPSVRPASEPVSGSGTRVYRLDD